MLICHDQSGGLADLREHLRQKGMSMKAKAERIKLFVIIGTLVSALIAAPAVAQDVVKIGAIYSLTGPAAGVAILQKNATELAVKEVNDTGGINVAGKKMKLEVVFGDDQSKPEHAAASFENLVKNQGVVAVVGGSFTHVILALNTAAKKVQALFIADLPCSGCFPSAGGQG